LLFFFGDRGRLVDRRTTTTTTGDRRATGPTGRQTAGRLLLIPDVRDAPTAATT